MDKFHAVLNQYGIMNVCEVYEIWTIHPDKCNEYRNAFEHDTSKLVYGLSKEFKSKLCNNAVNREIDEFELTYSFLSKVCLGNPKIGKRIENKLKKIQQEDNNSKVVLRKYGGSDTQ